MGYTGIFIGLNGIFLRYFHGKIIEIFTVEWDLFIFVHWIIGYDQIQWESFRQQYMMLVAELLRYTSNIWHSISTIKCWGILFTDSDMIFPCLVVWNMIFIFPYIWE